MTDLERALAADDVPLDWRVCGCEPMLKTLRAAVRRLQADNAALQDQLESKATLLRRLAAGGDVWCDRVDLLSNRVSLKYDSSVAILRDQVVEREETGFRAGHRCWPNHGKYEDEALASWRERQKVTP